MVARCTASKGALEVLHLALIVAPLERTLEGPSSLFRMTAHCTVSGRRRRSSRTSSFSLGERSTPSTVHSDSCAAGGTQKCCGRDADVREL